jgi:tetratricopeptide (TPR) repeat protein
MRIRYLFLAVTVLVVSAFQAMAANNRDIQDCNQRTDYDRQISGCSRALSWMKPPAERARIHTLRGMAFTNKEEFNRAIDDYDQAIRLDPKYLWSWLNRAEAWYRKGETGRAFADLEEAARLDPNNSRVYSVRASTWWQLGELDKAIADYSEAIRLEPAFSVFYNNRALVWRDKGDYDKAIADYDEAIRRDPRDVRAYANRGEIWRLKGDLDRALADQEKQIRISPRSPNSYLTRGDTFRYRGEFERALADYDKTLLLELDSIPAYTGRGLTFERLGNSKRARAEFEKALASRSQNRSDVSKSSLETAKARLAALNSGAVQPVIHPAPTKATSPKSLPTPAALVPAVATQPTERRGRRVALVIGNSAYRSVPVLSNPPNDAEAIAKSLRNVGFETVTLANDLTREKLIDALRTFANEAENSDWAMVYYAGHGIEVGGVNYLVPVDAMLAVDRDIEYEAVPLSQVLRATDAAKKIKLVMLDACRDNPFAPRKTAAPEAVVRASTAGAPIASRSTNGRGLAEVKVTGATLVVFAAKDGQIALDGEGGNSPFAVAVVQRMATPGVEINKVFRLVRDDVMEATAGRQEPYTYGSLPGKEDFFFVAR